MLVRYFNVLLLSAGLAWAVIASGCGGGGGGGSDAVRPQAPQSMMTCSFVVSDNGALTRVQSDGSRTVMLSGAPFDYALNPSLSRDGKKVIFSGLARSGGSDIWSCNCDGTGLTQLTRGAGNDSNPDWSPDGNYIVFQRGNVVYSMASGGASLNRLTETGFKSRRPRWSKGAGNIVFSTNISGTFEVWEMSSSGGGKRQLTNGDAGTSAVNPEWIDDGGAVVFERAGKFSALGAGGLPSLPGGDNPRLYIRSMTTGNTVLVAGSTAMDRMPVYFNGPRDLVVLRGSSFYRMRLEDGGRPEQLIN